MLKMLCSSTFIDFQICHSLFSSLPCLQDAVCNCNRAPETILCQKCGKSFVGRRRMSCERHRNTIHLMDCAYCVFCKRQLQKWMKENPWPPALTVTALLNLLGPHAVILIITTVQQASLQFSFSKPDWLFPCNTVNMSIFLVFAVFRVMRSSQFSPYKNQDYQHPPKLGNHCLYNHTEQLGTVNSLLSENCLIVTL